MKIENEEILSRHGIRLTAMRLLIYRTMQKFEDTFSMGDLMDELESADKSTIYRILRLFARQDLIHEINDGSGSRKYCLCHNDRNCNLEDLHCHFYCVRCHKTYCLYNTPIPIVDCPEGFAPQTIEYLIKGICPECAEKESE